MNDALRIGKKAFTVAVAAATILWTVGIATLVVPTAQAVDAGDVIRGETLSTLYYYSSDGQRYAFPNEKTYFTWYEDFSDVTTVTDAELADIALAGNVVYRPGSRWIKIESSAKTYAVTTDGTIRWIETEDVAVGLAGDDWNQFIDDVPDVYFTDYSEGTSLMDASAGYEGALVSGSTYLIWDGEKRLVTDDGFTANRFQTRFLLDGDGVDLDAMDAGDDVEADEGRLSDTSQVSESGAAVVVSGDLTFSLASDTPAGASIPEGAAAVPFLTFDVSGTGDISGLVFDLGGVGVTTNLSNVYLYEGLTRLTDGRSVNASTRQVTFTGLDLEFAGSDRTFTVRSDISSTSVQGDTASLDLASADSITTDAAIGGAFPIGGNSMTMAETDAGTITIAKNGNPSNPTLGESQSTIAKIRLTAGTEDASVEQVSFTVKKASDHSNYTLYYGDEMLGEGTVAGDLVTFDLSDDPFEIVEGQNRNFDMKADIGGDADDNIKVTIPQDTDLLAIGSDFGFNMAVDNDAYDSTTSSCSATTSECSYMTIQGGKLTFAFNGPTAGQIEQGGQDQVLMNFTLTSSEYTTVKDIYVTFSADDDDSNTVDFASETATDGETDGMRYSATVNNLTDLAIRTADGAYLMGPMEYDNSATETGEEQITFTDDFTMEAGESLELMVTADVYSSAPNEYFAASLDSGTNAEDANGDALAASSIVPTSDLVGNGQQSQSSTLTLTLSSPPTSSTYVKGASDVDFIGWSWTAGDASDITLTDLTIYLQSDSDTSDSDLDGDLIATPANHVNSCSLYDGLTGSLIDGPESFDTTSDYATFSSFSWTVGAGESGKMLVTCDLANVALDTGVAATDGHFVYITDTTDITAQDEDGDAPTITGSDANRNEQSSPTTSNTTYQSVVASDTVTLVAATDTPSAAIVLGASTDVLVTKVKATATSGYEASTITKLRVEDGQTPDTAEFPTASVKLSYENQDGDAVTKTGYMTAGYIDFSNLDWYVPQTGASYLEIYVDTNTVGVTGANSGDTMTIVLDTADNNHEYVGLSSGTTTSTIVDSESVTGSGNGNTMTLYKSKPTVSLASGSPSGAGIPGLAEVFRFNVSADSRGDVGIDEFTFAMTSTDNTGTPTTWNVADQTGDEDDDSGLQDADFDFYDLDDPSTKLDVDADWNYYDSSDGTACDDATEVVDWIVLDLTTVDTVAAGDTITYSLFIETLGASAANDDSVRIDLPADSTVSSFSGTDPDGTIIWDDNDGYDGDGGSANLNLDGTLVKSLPVYGGTIIY